MRAEHKYFFLRDHRGGWVSHEIKCLQASALFLCPNFLHNGTIAHRPRTESAPLYLLNQALLKAGSYFFGVKEAVRCIAYASRFLLYYRIRTVSPYHHHISMLLSHSISVSGTTVSQLCHRIIYYIKGIRNRITTVSMEGSTMKKLFVVLFVITTFVSFVSAAPVNNVISSKSDAIENLEITAEADFISERELENTDNTELEMEMDFLQSKIAYRITDKINLYALLGTVRNAKIVEKYISNTYKYFFDNDFAWGIGASVLIYEFENGIKIGADGKYRTAEANLTEIDINGTKYGMSSISDVSGKFEEHQISLSIAKEFGEVVKFIPYTGIKYSDVKVQAEGTILGVTYKTDNVGSKNIIGGHVGIEIALVDNFNIYVEGRFIDETAVSTGFTWKF